MAPVTRVELGKLKVRTLKEKNKGGACFVDEKRGKKTQRSKHRRFRRFGVGDAAKERESGGEREGRSKTGK